MNGLDEHLICGCVWGEVGCVLWEGRAGARVCRAGLGGEVCCISGVGSGTGSGWACGAGGEGSGVAGLAAEARRAASRGWGLVLCRGGLVVLEEWAPGSQGWLFRRQFLHRVRLGWDGVGLFLASLSSHHYYCATVERFSRWYH